MVKALEFEVKKVPPPGAEEKVQRRAQEVINTLTNATTMNLVFINSEAISGWNPRSKKWPTFRRNVQSFVGAVGAKGNLLSAANAEEVAQRLRGRSHDGRRP